MKLLLILPIIGSFIIAVLPKETVENKERIKQVALLTSILTLLEGIKI